MSGPSQVQKNHSAELSPFYQFGETGAELTVVKSLILGWFYVLIAKLLKDAIIKNPLDGEENGNPLQCSCLENPRDGRAWWAAAYGVTQSRT